MKKPFLKALLLAAALVVFAAESPLAPDLSAVLDFISADSLRGHVSFLASDLLEGRATPSRGQDIAAEYIAAQFRRAGLEAGGGGGYFQTAKVTPPRKEPGTGRASSRACEPAQCDRRAARCGSGAQGNLCCSIRAL